MSKRLFVGGLSYNITDDQLRDLFAKFGNVIDCKVIFDKFTNQSKGFGFVEMEKDEEADAAIQALHDTEVDGRKIAVNIAKPREDRPAGGFGGGNRGGFDRNNRGGGSNRW